MADTTEDELKRVATVFAVGTLIDYGMEGGDGDLMEIAQDNAIPAAVTYASNAFLAEPLMNIERAIPGADELTIGTYDVGKAAVEGAVGAGVQRALGMENVYDDGTIAGFLKATAYNAAKAAAGNYVYEQFS